LINAPYFLTFIFNNHVNAVLFGHTHESFFGGLSVYDFKDQIMYRRKYPRLIHQLFPRYFSDPQADIFSFSRVPTNSGRLPSFDRYFEYLYIKNILNKDIKGV
jgi:hypothetical protein